MVMGIRLGDERSLLLLLLLPLLIMIYRRYLQGRKKLALRFSSVESIRRSKPGGALRLHLPFALLMLALLLIILGLADPRLPVGRARGVNLVLALDVSGSMAATDYKPTRLEAAKAGAERLIEGLHSSDNVGIVVFEKGASTASYLTPYREKALESLKGIRQRGGSTALGDGLKLAVDMASSLPGRKKVVVLLSDGVSNAGMLSPEEAAAFAKDNGVQVYTVGIGSEKPVILRRDIFGRPVYAELDEATLKMIAEKTGGEYYRSVDEATLNEIYRRIQGSIEEGRVSMSVGSWFYAAALAVLVLNIYLIYGRYRIVL